MCLVRVDRSNQQIISERGFDVSPSSITSIRSLLVTLKLPVEAYAIFSTSSFYHTDFVTSFFLFVCRICPSKNKRFPLFLTEGPYILYRKFRITIAQEKSSYIMRILQSSQNINIENVFYRNSVSIVTIVPSNTTTFERHCQFVSSLKRL